MTQKNKKGQRVDLFYGRYGFKQAIVMDKSKIQYMGSIDECDEDLLEGTTCDRHPFKFCIVWKEI